MLEIIKHKCPHCKQLRTFMFTKGKNNRKWTCRYCGAKIFVKLQEDIARHRPKDLNNN